MSASAHFLTDMYRTGLNCLDSRIFLTGDFLRNEYYVVRFKPAEEPHAQGSFQPIANRTLQEPDIEVVNCHVWDLS